MTQIFRVLDEDPCPSMASYTFAPEWDRTVIALEEMTLEGWIDGIGVRLVVGPRSHLFGEETALLEVADQRQPFPRVTPPWRRGLGDEQHPDVSASTAVLATPGTAGGPPALVNNVETFANVALIAAQGADWFREIGTEESAGSVVCTVVGDVKTHGVAEFPMHVTARHHRSGGGGANTDRRIVAVLPGASSPVVGEAFLDAPVSHEGFKTAGSALGSAGFLCIDDRADLFSLTHGGCAVPRHRVLRAVDAVQGRRDGSGRPVARASRRKCRRRRRAQDRHAAVHRRQSGQVQPGHPVAGRDRVTRETLRFASGSYGACAATRACESCR
jgi:hypothetical protein